MSVFPCLLDRKICLNLIVKFYFVQTYGQFYLFVVTLFALYLQRYIRSAMLLYFRKNSCEDWRIHKTEDRDLHKSVAPDLTGSVHKTRRAACPIVFSLPGNASPTGTSYPKLCLHEFPFPMEQRSWRIAVFRVAVTQRLSSCLHRRLSKVTDRLYTQKRLIHHPLKDKYI